MLDTGFLGLLEPGFCRAIVALDPPAGVDAVSWCLGVIERTRGLAAGYKVGLPLLVRAGAYGARRVARAMGDGVLRIADLKLADSGEAMASVAGELVGMGFNAVIAHGFTGARGGLEPLARALDDLGARLIVVVSMSHPGASKTMDPLLGRLARVAVEAGCWGVVAPATRPHVVSWLRRFLNRVAGRRIAILSPGIGAQGARPGEAIRAGADYEIVGRLVAWSRDPRRALEEVNRAHTMALRAVDRGYGPC